MRLGACSTVLALAVCGATLAQAQTIEIHGDTTGGPIWDRPNYDLDGLEDIDAPFATHLITILDALAFVAFVPVSGLRDPYIFLYRGVFDAANPLVNLLAGDDDAGLEYDPELSHVFNALITSADGPFEEGQYTLVVTGFCCGQQGTYVAYLEGAVVGWGLTSDQQFQALQSIAAQSGRQTLRIVSANIASALHEGETARRLTFSSKGSAQGGAAMPAQDAFVWLRMANSNVSGSGRKQSMPFLQAGVDWNLGANLVGGVSLSGASLSSSSSVASLNGHQTILQPYLGWSLGDWRATGSLLLGSMTYTNLTTTGGTASAKGQMLAGTFDISRDFKLPNSARLQPFASLRVGQIELTETGGSLAATGIGRTTSFAETRLGAAIEQKVGPGLAKLSLSADYFDTNAPFDLLVTPVSQTGWSGSIGVGYEAALGNGLSIGGFVQAGGIGTDQLSKDASLTFSWSF